MGGSGVGIEGIGYAVILCLVHGAQRCCVSLVKGGGHSRVCVGAQAGRCRSLAVIILLMVGEGFQHLNVHALVEVVAWIQHGDSVAGGAERVGNRVPAEADEVDAHPVVHGRFYAGDHVGVAGNEHDIADDPADGAQHHVGYESCVDALLGAAVAPFDKLASAQLYSIDVAERALVTVGAGVRDSVVPELAVDREMNFVANNSIKVAGHSR